MSDFTLDFRKLAKRKDVYLLGLVVVTGQERTMTYWCKRKDIKRALAKIDAEPAAVILFKRTGLDAVVREDWQVVPWFTRYVEDVTRDLFAHVEAGGRIS